MHIAFITMPLGAALGCALAGCEPSWDLEATVEVPAEVRAATADSLPAVIWMRGEKLMDQARSPVAGDFLERVAMLCPGDALEPLVVTKTVNEIGCATPTRVRAWLAPIAASDLEPNMPCGPDYRLPPSAWSEGPEPDAPQAEAVAFAHLEDTECDGDRDSVHLVLALP